MWANCFVWAHWRYMILCREWIALGRPIERVPALLARPSRSVPWWAGHWIAGWWLPFEGVLEEVTSFVPHERRNVPWWMAWTRLLFKGRVKKTDAPSNYP